LERGKSERSERPEAETGVIERASLSIFEAGASISPSDNGFDNATCLSRNWNMGDPVTQ
jgi:hypothetical protein